MCVAAGMAAAAVIGGIASYAASDNASSKAANAQKNAAAQASATQLGMFNQIQTNEKPWVSEGQQANQALGQFYGLPGQNGQTSKVDYNKLLSSLPGYQFQLQQGTQATEHNLAARGLLDSGAAQKSLMTYGQGLAQNYAGQYTQGLQNLSQMGQAGAANVATNGMNAANNISGNQIYAGNAAAAGSMNQAYAIGQGLQGLTGAYNQYQSYQNAQYGPAYQGPTSGYAAAGYSNADYSQLINSIPPPSGGP